MNLFHFFCGKNHWFHLRVILGDNDHLTNDKPVDQAIRPSITVYLFLFTCCASLFLVLSYVDFCFNCNLHIAFSAAFWRFAEIFTYC